MCLALGVKVGEWLHGGLLGIENVKKRPKVGALQLYLSFTLAETCFNYAMDQYDYGLYPP
jgi:hypothetical protein